MTCWIEPFQLPSKYLEEAILGAPGAVLGYQCWSDQVDKVKSTPNGDCLLALRQTSNEINVPK